MTVETVEVQCRDCKHFQKETEGCGGYCSAPVPDFVNGIHYAYRNGRKESNCQAFEAVPCPYTKTEIKPNSTDLVNAELDPDDLKATAFGLAVVFGLVVLAAVFIHFTTGTL